MNEKPIGTSVSSSYENRSQPQRAKASAEEAARDLVQGVKHTAGEVADQARQAAESRLASGKEKALDRLDSVANAIRKTGQHLREEDDGIFTDYFDRIARRVDDTSGYLRGRTLGQVVEDVESFARREPALFLGGAFALGLVGGRFLKSSKSAGTAEASRAPSMSPRRISTNGGTGATGTTGAGTTTSGVETKSSGPR